MKRIVTGVASALLVLALAPACSRSNAKAAAAEKVAEEQEIDSRAGIIAKQMTQKALDAEDSQRRETTHEAAVARAALRQSLLSAPASFLEAQDVQIVTEVPK